jgi:transposase
MSAKTRLSPREKLRIFLEGLKDNVKVAEVCRREEIWPNEYYRIKEKALSGALEALKNSGKKKDPEKNRLKKEIERLRDIVLSQAEEIDLLKKRPIGIIRTHLWL